MHQGWPKFTQNLWYATQDGLAAFVYAPCTVKATVPGGTQVTIKETTDYPFRETVSFKIDFKGKKNTEVPFVLTLRIPDWSNGATMDINGQKQDISACHKSINIKRSWKKGDVVTLTFRQEVKVEEWWDNAWTITRGPLVYALKMEENIVWKAFEGHDRLYGNGFWEVTSNTPWNYCLMRDSFKPGNCGVSEHPLTGYPWNKDNAPVSITVPARTLPGWTDIENVSYWTEEGNDTGEECTIDLIPYGCTTLRIAEFPTRVIPWDLSYRETY